MLFNPISTTSNATLGTTAVRYNVPNSVVDISGNGGGARIVNAVHVTNDHASAVIYGAFDRTATATDNDFSVPPNSTEAVKVRNTTSYLSLISSGASTTHSVEFGSQK